ncbi:MAG: DeoR family transcriptional regulator [Candidatus Omnitrophota bacterium]|nr:DeoR family transcriptional regulator [Candidatus Omnitrophota bacterium]
MVKTTNYDKRRQEVLAAVVDSYIRNANAVSSEALASNFNYSSATIRNIMSELEDIGMLTHTHTSSGRIPTDIGYRFYVDNLLMEIELLQVEKDEIIGEYRKSARELDALLEKTSDLLSSLTHCTGIVSFADGHEKIFYRGMGLMLEQPEFHDLKRIRMLMNLLEERQSLLEVINRNLEEKIKIYIGRELPFESLDNCTLITSNYKVKDKPQGRIAVLGPTRMEYAKIIPAIEYVSEMLSSMLSDF